MNKQLKLKLLIFMDYYFFPCQILLVTTYLSLVN